MSYDAVYTRDPTADPKGGPAEVRLAVARTASGVESMRALVATRDALVAAGLVVAASAAARRTRPWLRGAGRLRRQRRQRRVRLPVCRFGRHLIAAFVAGTPAATSFDQTLGYSVRMSARLRTLPSGQRSRCPIRAATTAQPRSGVRRPFDACQRTATDHQRTAGERSVSGRQPADESAGRRSGCCAAGDHYRRRAHPQRLRSKPAPSTSRQPADHHPGDPGAGLGTAVSAGANRCDRYASQQGPRASERASALAASRGSWQADNSGTSFESRLTESRTERRHQGERSVRRRLLSAAEVFTPRLVKP